MRKSRYSEIYKIMDCKFSFRNDTKHKIQLIWYTPATLDSDAECRRMAQVLFKRFTDAGITIVTGVTIKNRTFHKTEHSYLSYSEKVFRIISVWVKPNTSNHHST